MDTLRVLIVDDEPGMREGAARILRKHSHELEDFDTTVGFEIVTAPDGGTAMALLDSESWDLMLLDYKMPDFTGLQVLEHAKSRDIDVVTVMVTAFASLDVAVSATKNGAFDFLAKPFTPAELKSTVDKAARSVLVHRQALKLEDEKRQVRFEFISVLAHELKAPLGVLESMLHMIEDRTLGDDLQKYDHLVERALARSATMRKLIKDLLDLTRIESGRRRREPEDLDLTLVVAEAVDAVRELAEERSISMETHLPKSLPYRADRGEMDIILSNLLTNAVKYNRDDGRVTVSLAGDDDLLQLTVADTGIGMSEEEAGRLFEEFVRIKNDATRHIEGTGLGLSIVRRLARQYGGDASVSSAQDVGSTFNVTLARKPDESGN